MFHCRIGAALIAAVSLVPVWPAAAQAPRLGAIHFPTSGSPAAQTHFLRGALYLHSFEYGSAARAFRDAQVADPDFAMAYWGEALAYNHPLWGEWDDAAARAALERLAATPAARRAKAPTERERLYLDAVEALWAPGPKPARDTAYSEALADLVRAFPDDQEAKALYALSILGLSGTTRVFASYMRAAAVAGEVFRANPDHPGGAHYLIHSFDDPVHAPLGLPAARAYSRIAPDAAHAQHMTTHIFLALGMWDEVVSQNEVAAGLTGWGPGHYTAWLEYGLLQQGRWADARAHLERAKGEMGTAARVGQRSYLASMRAHYVINTERWDDAVLDWAIDLEGSGPIPRAMDTFVSGYAALKRGDRAGAQAALAALQPAAPPDSASDPYGGNAGRIAVMARSLEAALAAAEGRLDAAIERLRTATTIEDGLPLEFGPPDIVKPSHELLGEVLLAANRPAEAQAAFVRALALAPKRARALAGLARAAAAAGDRKSAARAAADLRAVWHAADPSLHSLAR